MGQFKDNDEVDIFVKLHDIVLVYINNKAVFFARVESIVDDKPGWYTVSFTSLTFPIKKFSWTLDDSHLCCQEFSLSGVPHKLEIIPMDLAPEWELVKKKAPRVFRPGNKVIQLFGEREPYKYEFKHEGAEI